MEFKKTAIEGVWVLEPKVFNDNRGYFFESYRQSDFDEHIGRHVEFVQDNESKSSYGVLRGLHYQKGEFSQAKLVRVISGRVVDVAVDIRKSSPTFGKYVAVELSGGAERARRARRTDRRSGSRGAAGARRAFGRHARRFDLRAENFPLLLRLRAQK